MNRDEIAKALYELDPYVAPSEFLGIELAGCTEGVVQLVGGGAYSWEQALEADQQFAAIPFYRPLTADAYRMADAALAGPARLNLRAAAVAVLAGPPGDDAALGVLEAAVRATQPDANALLFSSKHEAELNALLSADNARMRHAGLGLAAAALYTIQEYDGLHRLALAVAAWAKAIANEGGREERHDPRKVVFPVHMTTGEPAPQQVLPNGR